MDSADSPLLELPATTEQPASPQLVEIASLGHLPAWIDAILLRSLGDPAYTPVSPGTHPPLFYELDLATKLDPDFEDLYWYGGSILSVVRRDGPGAETLLARADARIQAGKLRHYRLILEITRGYNALYELQDLELAKLCFARAASLPDSPPYLLDLSRRLETIEGRFEVARRTFAQLLQREKDEELKRQLELRWAGISTAEQLYRINLAFKRWAGTRLPSGTLLRTYLGPNGPDLVWDPARQQVETREPRETIPGLY
jgi:hypothetical protein